MRLLPCAVRTVVADFYECQENVSTKSENHRKVMNILKQLDKEMAMKIEQVEDKQAQLALAVGYLELYLAKWEIVPVQWSSESASFSVGKLVCTRDGWEHPSSPKKIESFDLIDYM